MGSDPVKATMAPADRRGRGPARRGRTPGRPPFAPRLGPARSLGRLVAG